MGVLSCDRNNCDNIMCDRYSPSFGYLCKECFEELVDIGTMVHIKDFMDSEKDKSPISKTTLRNFYSEIFPFPHIS